MQQKQIITVITCFAFLKVPKQCRKRVEHNQKIFPKSSRKVPPTLRNSSRKFPNSSKQIPQTFQTSFPQVLKKIPKSFKQLQKHKKLSTSEGENMLSNNKKYVFDDFWLFLRSLSYIGSSGKLVGRIYPKFRSNPPQ